MGVRRRAIYILNITTGKEYMNSTVLESWNRTCQHSIDYYLFLQTLQMHIQPHYSFHTLTLSLLSSCSGWQTASIFTSSLSFNSHLSCVSSVSLAPPPSPWSLSLQLSSVFLMDAQSYYNDFLERSTETQRYIWWTCVCACTIACSLKMKLNLCIWRRIMNMWSGL